MLNKLNIHEKVHFFGLFLLAASLPLSKFTLSVSQLILVVNWIVSANFSAKWSLLKQNKPALFFVFIYLIHLLGLLYTNNDINYALNDLRIKLPLLGLPIILATFPPLNSKKFNQIIGVFILAVVVGTLFSFAAYLGYTTRDVNNARNFSLFISHIRFAILIAIAIVLCIFYLVKAQRFWHILVILIITFWLFFVLIFLEAVTGFVLLFVAGIVYSLTLLLKKQKLLQGLSVILLMLCIAVGIGGYAYQEIKYFFIKPQLNLTSLKQNTVNGELYYHDTTRLQVENGNLVWVNIAVNELKTEWQKVSKVPFDGRDLKGQNLQSTLIRYMASLNLSKDSIGIINLSKEDVAAIEKGETNYRFINQGGLNKRIYQISWEIDNYLKGGNPGGNSVIQRLEFWKAGLHIVKQNTLLGVGTGDVRYAFDEAYKQTNSPLKPQHRLKAHNQFLTFIITFGFIGFLLIMLAIIMPFLYPNKQVYFNLFVIVYTMILTSMLSEDTLETQIGATLFAFFAVFLLYGYRKN